MGGGVELIAKDNGAFSIENEKTVGPNVITFELITGKTASVIERWYVARYYLPPSDKEGKAQRLVIQALKDQLKGITPSDRWFKLQPGRPTDSIGGGFIDGTSGTRNGVRQSTFLTRHRRRPQGKWR